MKNIRTKEELQNFVNEWLETEEVLSDYFMIDTDTDEYLQLSLSDDSYCIEVFDKDNHLTVNEIYFEDLDEVVNTVIETYEMTQQ